MSRKKTSDIGFRIHCSGENVHTFFDDVDFDEGRRDDAEPESFPASCMSYMEAGKTITNSSMEVVR